MPEEVPPNNDSTSLDQLRTRLYSQTAPPVFHPAELPQEPTSSLGDVQTPPIPLSWITRPTPPEPKKRFSWTVLFLGFAVIFFVISGIAAYFFLVAGGNAVSSNNITITVSGPTTIASGATVPLAITIKNNNGVAITQPDITLTFPDGTRSADDVTQPLLRYADMLPSIPAGGTATVNVKAVLFGGINQSASIPITFEYNTNGSDALFTKSQNFSYTVTSSPLSITSQAVSNISSGQPFTIQLAVRSNSTTPLNNIGVSAQYPFGFTVQKIQITSSPQSTLPVSPGTFFTLGTLAPGQEKDITITGILTGVENSQNAFQFTVGTQSVGTESLAIPYASQTSNLTITKPFLSATLSLNHANTNPTIVTAGESIAGIVTWMNTITSSIKDAQVAIQLSGSALDPKSVQAQNGYFDSSNDTLYFTPQTEASLASLAAGDTGNGAFTFATKTGSALNALRNPTVVLKVSVSGDPSGGGPETLTDSTTNTIQIQTTLSLASRIVHSIGPFTDSGPWPPKPNQATTYTVQLAATNTVNPVGGATATMILPAYVTFTGNVSPNDGSITYNPATHTVTWAIGNIAAGTGTSAPADNAAFQISFTPSDSQVQGIPVLVGNQAISSVDRFTQATVGGTAPALTTEATADPAYQPSFGIVGN